MFHTLTGSLMIFLSMLGIIFVFAIFMTVLLRWIFGREEEAVAWSAMVAPTRVATMRRAA